MYSPIFLVFCSNAKGFFCRLFLKPDIYQIYTTLTGVIMILASHIAKSISPDQLNWLFFSCNNLLQKRGDPGCAPVLLNHDADKA